MPVLESQRDEPGTLREYETIYILRPDASSDEIHEVNDLVRATILEKGGKVIRLDNWGKRKLSYEVQKQLKGIYLYWLYLGSQGMVSEIERKLRMKDLAIRHFTVAVDENVHPDVRPTQFDEDSFTAAATLVPDEEDAYMGRTYKEGEEPDEEGGERRADGEAKPAEAKEEAKPAEKAKPVEAKPAEKAKPVEAKEEAKPAKEEAKPAKEEAKPAAKEAKPAEKAKPAAKEAKPAAKEAKPAEEAKPAAEEAPEETSATQLHPGASEGGEDKSAEAVEAPAKKEEE